MNTILWIIQGLLSAFFILPGYGKITGSKEKHVNDGHLKPNDSIVPIRILGMLELLGCVGIIIPWLLGIAPILTPITATGFCLIMLAGIVVHTRKKEYKMFPMLMIVFILSAVVAYFRFAALVSQ
ncbi:DoxX-like protein [Chitinophaga dinghuensis]|uniref:DoxX-like protein n=1 Tax=Chitinophaga dinghuensis TaxID=1539050 RepID=A0A327VN55_9BACT|nr:DoxX family protein [Chitinophaga dinghuensis]RAJ74958.1 DoxX-like protein [Chitinophaga dinghuensis]